MPDTGIIDEGIPLAVAGFTQAFDRAPCPFHVISPVRLRPAPHIFSAACGRVYPGIPAAWRNRNLSRRRYWTFFKAIKV